MGSFLSTLESWMLPPEKLVTIGGRQFAIRKPLGEGGFSFVYYVEDLRTKEHFALKRILIQSKDQLKEAEREIEAHGRLPAHKNIIPLLDSCVAQSHVVKGGKDVLLLLPYYHRGTLDHIIRSRENQKTQGKSVKDFSQHALLELFIGVCHGLSQFHSLRPPLAHRDIKPGNIMLNDDGVPVLMDFGSVREARVSVHNRQEALRVEEDAARHSTMPYRAPELFNVASDCEIDERTDIWSLGCTLYAMAFGGWSPFDRQAQQSNGSIALAVVNGSVEVPAGHHYSPEFIELILYMLNTDPQKRPTLDQVVERANMVLARFPQHSVFRKGESSSLVAPEPTPVPKSVPLPPSQSTKPDTGLLVDVGDSVSRPAQSSEDENWARFDEFPTSS